MPITPRPLQRLTHNWHLPELPCVELLQPFITHYQFDNRNLLQAEVPVPQNTTARLLGTFTHQVMHMIGQQGLAVWRGKTWMRLCPFGVGDCSLWV
ncbi:MAG: hypothetical protein NVV73_00365 [Cellvibrionaceae bacterium]|nr:hypothetical protein [Cellvibrionaceae bacterium]